MAGIQDVENWIMQCAMGDRSAFEALYAATSAKLFGVTLRVLKDKGTAQEALQDTYIKVWKNAGRYQSNGLSPMSWLITIARNAAIDRLRKQGGAAAHEHTSELMDTIADGALGPEEQLIARADMQHMRDCMIELDPAHAKAVAGAYLDGASYAELAEAANVPLNTMRTWLRRSLMKLRECLTR